MSADVFYYSRARKYQNNQAENNKVTHSLSSLIMLLLSAMIVLAVTTSVVPSEVII
jgi:hypothetical protein